MATRRMLIIRNDKGEIIGAQVEDDPTGNGIGTFITPARPEHVLHRAPDVPAEICKLTHPEEFREAIAGHLGSADARTTQISAEELQAAYFPRQS